MTDSPAGIREVRDLVEASERRTAEKIERVGENIANLVSSHEHRMTLLEASQVIEKSELNDHETRLRELELRPDVSDEVKDLDDRVVVLEQHTKLLSFVRSKAWVLVSTFCGGVGTYLILAYFHVLS